MHTFVLVHGAWDGGWFWSPIADRLRARGHRAYAVTLTGLGERSHLVEAPIDLALHIQDVVHVLEFEELTAVHLVGHGYGGFVATGVADRVPQRLQQLIYVDGFVPQDGQSFLDLLPPEERAIVADRMANDTTSLPYPGVPYDSRLRPHPLDPLTQRIVLKNPDRQRVPTAFVHCTGKGEPVPPLYGAVEASAQLARERGWPYRTLPTGHNPNFTMPDRTTEVLLELADLAG